MSTSEKSVPVTPSSEEEKILPTNGQEDPPTKDEEDDEQKNYVSSLEQRIAEQQIQNRRLEKLIDGIRQDKEERTQPPPKVRNIEEERNNFYKDPRGALESALEERDSKILKQMERMLEPIKKVASSFENDNEYKQLKFMIKSDPHFGKGLKDPDIEMMVDNIMGQPGVEINDNNIKSAISQAVGMKSMGLLGPTRTRTTDNEERVDPPHVRTNRTRITKEVDVRKTLTEDDKLAMKIAGLKPGNPEHEKQYWDLIQDDTMVLPVHKKKEG
jgi:hypothetical protein